MDLELIDVNTCEPVDPDLFVGIWSANATGALAIILGMSVMRLLSVQETGVYSDVSSGGQFQTESSNLNTTFLRGVQPTQQGGYVQFKTLFPVRST